MAKKILFIEDEMRLQETLGTKLKEEGYEVFAALDGEAGLKMAKEKKPDLILLDLILPKMDGFKFLEKIRGITELKEIPIVVLTNLETRKDVDRAIELGVRSYLVKANYSLDDVVGKVREMLK